MMSKFTEVYEAMLFTEKQYQEIVEIWKRNNCYTYSKRKANLERKLAKLYQQINLFKGVKTIKMRAEI